MLEFIGYAFGIGLLLIILFNRKVYKKWSTYNRLRLIVLIIFIIGFALVFGIRYYSLNTGLTKQEIIHLLYNANENNIDYIKIYNIKSEACTKKLISDTIIIENKATIALFTLKLRNSKVFLPNHPHCHWKLKIEIKFLNDITLFFDAKQSTDKENGFFLTPYKKALYGRFPLGRYKNDELGEFLISLFEDD